MREVIRGRALLIHPLYQKFCATPKSGVYNFCIFETVDLAKILENFHQIHSFQATKIVNHSFWGSRKFLINWWPLSVRASAHYSGVRINSTHILRTASKRTATIRTASKRTAYHTYCILYILHIIHICISNISTYLTYLHIIHTAYQTYGMSYISAYHAYCILNVSAYHTYCILTLINWIATWYYFKSYKISA